MQEIKTAPAAKDWIMAIAPYVAGRSKSADGRPVAKLSSNENPLGTSPMAREAFHCSETALERYPDPGAVALRDAIAAKYGLEADRITCGTGSDELLHLVAGAFAGPGDEVVHVRYGFVVYDIATRRVGATPVVAPDRDYATDVDALLANVTPATTLVYVANPNNPTGTLASRDEIARLHSGLPAHVVLVIDQAYAEYLTPDQDDGALYLARTAPNVLVTRTFSKIYGLAAERIGWAYGAPAIIGAINRIRGTFNVTSAGQRAAIAALDDDGFVAASRAHNEHWRDWLANEIAALRGHKVNAVPSACNFVLATFDGEVGAEQAYRGLEERGLLTRWRAAPGLEHGLRITIGTENEVRAVAAGLREILEAG